MAQLSWDEACSRVMTDDGMPTRPVGAWSEDKLFVWHKYIQLTAEAMVGNRAFPDGLFYVDLFAGPGVCQIRGTSRRLPGSPLIAAWAPKAFSHLFIVEASASNADACRRRLDAVGAGNRSTVFASKCQSVAPQIARKLPRGALTLAFLDPEGLDADFETVATLADAGRVDLLVLFADAVDAVRNLESLLDGTDGRLDRMFGPGSDWRKSVKDLPNWDGNNLREFLSREYLQQLRTKLGYVATDTKIIEGPNGPLYRLVYASKHHRGLDFWRKVDHRDRRGQEGLFGP
jgi:three-Cys-motif partner protein